MNTLRRLVTPALLLLSAASSAVAEDACGARPVRMDPADIRTTTLILTTPRTTYGIKDKCLILRRSEFAPILHFGVVNRFPEGAGVSSAYIFVKSTRTLSSTPLVKVSLSRGSGWFSRGADGSSSPSIPEEMKYAPYKGTIEQWNTAHSNSVEPAQLNGFLNMPWHAFAMKDLTLSSSELPLFWKIDTSFDQMHGVQTNYLLRFDVNESTRLGTVPFDVFLQAEVQQIELSVYSNVDALSGSYKFLLR